MLTVQVKFSVDEIINSLQSLDISKIEKLQNALYGLRNDLDLQNAIQEGIADVKNGRVTPHELVKNEIKAKYGL